MNVEEAIERRFSCRHFSDRKIPDEEIINVINAARLAPSAHNRQNWTFMILKDEKKNQLSRIMLSLLMEIIRTSLHSARLPKSVQRSLKTQVMPFSVSRRKMTCGTRKTFCPSVRQLRICCLKPHQKGLQHCGSETLSTQKIK